MNDLFGTACFCFLLSRQSLSDPFFFCFYIPLIDSSAEHVLTDSRFQKELSFVTGTEFSLATITFSDSIVLIHPVKCTVRSKWITTFLST